MTSRALVSQPQQQQPRGGEEKVKNLQADGGRNRRVLQDIGNLVTHRAVEGKPQAQIARPTTRFGAELLAKAQAQAIAVEGKPQAKAQAQAIAVEGKPQAQIARPTTRFGAELLAKAQAQAITEKNKQRAGAAQKRVSNKPKPEDTVIVISSDEEDKAKPAAGRASRKGAKANTFTSVLSARSKAACGLTNKPKDPIQDIDAADVDNELAMVEYIDDMYQFYKLTEDENRVHDYMHSQPEINAKMRSILIDWLIDVHRKFELMPETLYLTINIVDRFLSVKVVPRRDLQLVGISSMLIACKYEEIWAPEVNDFVCISDKAYVREQVLVMEKAILGKLDWYLTVPTPYVFLVRYIKASLPSDKNKEMENMVYFLGELGMMHYPTAIMYCPSMIAASAVYAARCTLDKSPLWSTTLKHHTGYSEDELRDCAKQLVKFHSSAAESKLKAIYRKFSSEDYGAVALVAPAKSLVSE